MIAPMELPTLRVSDRLRSVMAYAKLARPQPRMLVLESRYWLDIACEHAAQQLGWPFRVVPVALEGTMGREAYEALFRALAEFRPDFVLTVNLSGMDVHGMLARFFNDIRLPYVAWFVDNPRTILMGRSLYGGEYAVALTWEERYAEYLRGCGFSAVHHVPMAVDPTVFDAEPAEEWRHPPTFVGSSNTEFAEREGAWIHERPELAAAVETAFEQGRVTRERFAEGLESILGADHVSGLDAEARRHVECYLFTEGTRRLRHALVEALEPDGLRVRGDEGWKANGRAVGAPLPYMTELPAFYRDCEINLNVTSIQMATTVNQRVFDCPAAGGFLLTDAQPGLEALFEPGREAAVYGSFDECRDLLQYYRRKPEERVAIVRRARRRIFAEHTYAHRLEHIAELLRQPFASA
jgi:spore maturation protein CgeB